MDSVSGDQRTGMGSPRNAAAAAAIAIAAAARVPLRAQQPAPSPSLRAAPKVGAGVGAAAAAAARAAAAAAVTAAHISASIGGSQARVLREAPKVSAAAADAAAATASAREASRTSAPSSVLQQASGPQYSHRGMQPWLRPHTGFIPNLQSEQERRMEQADVGDDEERAGRIVRTFHERYDHASTRVWRSVGAGRAPVSGPRAGVLGARGVTRNRQRSPTTARASAPVSSGRGARGAT